MKAVGYSQVAEKANELLASEDKWSQDKQPQSERVIDQEVSKGQDKCLSWTKA